jgi:hypothetical protein
MDEQSTYSLKSLLELLPPGAFVDSRWLAAHGVLRSSIAQYAKAGWLERVAHGLYRRPESPSSAVLPADWRAVVLAAQALMGYPLHLGGTTALREDGHMHDLAFGPRPVHLYATSVPGWMRRLPTSEPLIFHSTRAFGDSPIALGPDTNASVPWWKRPLRRSEPERAILEALDELPEGESFSTLDRLFEGLVGLRPRRLTAALEACASVKAKRLLFVFAERHGHSWLKHLDRNRVDLGKGDRSLVKGGKLHTVWRITVPADMLVPAREVGDGG